MIYITGYTHRDFDRLEELLYCTESPDDMLIIQSDVGIKAQSYQASKSR